MSSIGRGPVIAFLPCRRGSERVAGKNTRPFGTYRSGLIELKLNQLLSCRAIDSVVLSTNDAKILNFANDLDAGGRLLVHHREDALSANTTSTDALIEHARDLIGKLDPNAHVLWTHVTSPFISAERYAHIVTSYAQALSEGYDSLVTTTQIHAYLWDEGGPINYDRSVEKWPRTQTLRPVHEVNSAAFLAPLAVYARYGDRIGARPSLYRLERLVALDIDWEADFIIAEQLLLNGLVAT